MARVLNRRRDHPNAQRGSFSFNNLMMPGEEALEQIEKAPEFSLESFSWGVLIFTIFNTAALLFVIVTAVLLTKEDPHEKSLWWRYFLAVILLFLEVYSAFQCKVELIHIDRDRGVITVIRRGLNWRKNYCLAFRIQDVVEIHLQETMKKVGDAAHAYAHKFKLALRLANGDVLQTLSSHNRAKATRDLHSVLRYIESCKQNNIYPAAQQTLNPPRRLVTGGTASTIDIHVVDHSAPGGGGGGGASGGRSRGRSSLDSFRSGASVASGGLPAPGTAAPGAAGGGATGYGGAGGGAAAPGAGNVFSISSGGPELRQRSLSSKSSFHSENEDGPGKTVEMTTAARKNKNLPPLRIKNLAPDDI